MQDVLTQHRLQKKRIGIPLPYVQDLYCSRTRKWAEKMDTKRKTKDVTSLCHFPCNNKCQMWIEHVAFFHFLAGNATEKVIKCRHHFMSRGSVDWIVTERSAAWLDPILCHFVPEKAFIPPVFQANLSQIQMKLAE